ncbi:MAG: 2-halobenzoate 1,2-dioxygenase electron transfer component [Firmicutes bacterium]|nr:2-halobenzoate 1,2-dioxygenase electron transfer component [candidate division NPL-UPA2 bacterium]
MRNYFIKTKRAFTPIRQYAWIFTLTVAIGGLWYPRLGILVFGVIFALTAISLFKGRFWCGNYCAHGSLFDQLFLPFSRNQKIPGFLKSKYTQIAVMTWFMYNLGSKFYRVSQIWGTLQFWDRLGFVFVSSYLMVTVVGGLLGLIYTPRSWCQFCPMGTMQVLMYKLGKKLGWTKQHDQKITIEALEKCHKCGKCARVCPMQLVPYTEFSDKNQFDREACIRCITCVDNCPANLLTLATADEAAAKLHHRDLRGYENRQRFLAVIKTVADLAPDIREFTLELVDPPTSSIQPGQYFLLRIQAQPEMFRAYSVSAKTSPGVVRVTVKRVQNGYGTSIIFESFTVGMEVVLEGPMGHELLLDPSARKILLIAGGIGITPFVPILQHLVKTGTETTLVYGANTEGEFIFDDLLCSLATESSSITYIKVAANPSNSYKGRKGLVTDEIKRLTLKGYKVYMCGPKGMVEASTRLLLELGVSASDISAESA